jgi:hypothetical protein
VDPSIQQLLHALFTVKAAVSGENYFFVHISLFIKNTEGLLHRVHHHFQMLRLVAIAECLRIHNYLALLVYRG